MRTVGIGAGVLVDVGFGVLVGSVLWVDAGVGVWAGPVIATVVSEDQTDAAAQL